MEKFRDGQLKILAVFFTAMMFILLYRGNQHNIKIETDSLYPAELSGKEESVSTDKTKIYVDIDGEVNNPGVYILPEGTKIVTLIEVAGGLSKNADTTNINRTDELVDGQKLIIPAFQQKSDENLITDPGNESEKHTEENDKGKININTAEKYQLIELPGIGEVISERIIQYRNIHGFNSAEEIKNVKGIGEKKFEAIKNMITVR